MRPLAVESPHWAAYAELKTLPPPAVADPMLPLVSIVTPSLNQGRFIGATIASVLDQDYPNLEYWVVDGGSSDETLAVIERFAGDPRLRWLSEHDHGQSDAINKGWARCHGQILAWLNADDTYFPGAVGRQVALLLAEPGAGAAYGDARYNDADGRPGRRVYGRPFSPEAVLSLEIPIQPTLFLRRELAIRAGPLSLTRRYSMDTDYWARILPEARWVQSGTLVATYRLHAASKTVAQSAGFYSEWLAIAHAYYARAELGPEQRAARAGVLADIYAAMANTEAQSGRLVDALRYGGYALTLAGPRKRMLKLPLAIADRVAPLGLAGQAMELWGRSRRALVRP